MKLQQALAIHEHALDCVNQETLRGCARVLGDALLQKQKAFDELCQIWEPVDSYARNHPDITLGESIAGFTLELMRKADALREQKPVVQYMARRLTPDATTEMWGYVLVEGLQPGAMLYAAPVAAPAVHKCRGITDANCHYLAVCGDICNKCGREHSPRVKAELVEAGGCAPAVIAAPASSVPEEWRRFVEVTAKPGLHQTLNGVDCSCDRCRAIRGARALLQSPQAQGEKQC